MTRRSHPAAKPARLGPAGAPDRALARRRETPMAFLVAFVMLAVIGVPVLQVSLMAPAALAMNALATSEAVSFELAGEVSHALSLSTRDWGTLASVSAARLDLGIQVGDAMGLFLQIEATRDWLVDVASVEASQAYVELSVGALDLVAGRQLITWGVADALNPMNFLCPARFEPGQTSLAGEPVDAVRASLYGDAYSLTGAAAFGFEPVDVYGMLERQGLFFPRPELPGATPADAEWAVLGEAWLEGWDLKAAWFDGWEDTPALWYDLQMPPVPPVPVPRAAYRRTSKVGLAAATTLNDFGLWAEAAYAMPRELPELDDPARMPLSYNQPYWQLVAGADYRTPNRMAFEVQYAYYGNGSVFNPYRLHAGGEPPEAASYLMARVSCDLSHSASAAGVVLYNVNDRSTLVVPQFIYDFGSGLSLTVTVTEGYGGAETEFGSPMVPRSVGFKLAKAF